MYTIYDLTPPYQKLLRLNTNVLGIRSFAQLSASFALFSGESKGGRVGGWFGPDLPLHAILEKVL